MATATPIEIDEFLQGRRLVVIGVSVIATDYTRIAMRTLAESGHDIVPVRPGVQEIEGRRAYPTVIEIPGVLEGALIFTCPSRTERAVYECAERGVRRFWLDPGGSRGVSPDAVELCARHGFTVLVGGAVPQPSLIRRLRRETARWQAGFAFRRA